jgi:hypothetical protein
MNLILSCAYGPIEQKPYHLITLRSYAELAKTAPVRMLWFCHGLDPEVLAYIQSCGVDTIDVPNGDWNRFGWDYRWLIYAEWLKDNWNKWESVLTIDAKDTLFQSDPFSYLPAGRICVSAEPVTYKECEWNSKEAQILINGIKPGMPAFNLKSQVINGGFIAGHPLGVLWLCMARSAMAAKWPDHSDQMGLGYIAHRLNYNLIQIVKPEEPWIGHGHHYDRWPSPAPDYAIFHQWQRGKVPEDVRAAIIKRWMPELEMP